MTSLPADLTDLAAQLREQLHDVHVPARVTALDHDPDAESSLEVFAPANDRQVGVIEIHLEPDAARILSRLLADQS